MNSQGAVILGVEYQALGMLRQLRLAGIPCVLVDEDRWGPARLSRWRCPFFQSPPYGADEFWPWLIDLQERHGLEGWTLIATHDEQVRQISQNYAVATERFRYAGPDWETYQVLYDKRLLYEWGQQRGLPQPRSFLPQSKDRFPDGRLDYPFIVKPAFKRNFQKYSKAKAIRVESEDQLRELLRGQLANVGSDELIYQEIIPGSGKHQWSYAGLFDKGKPLAAFTARRARQHPPDFGRASTYAVAEYDCEVETESRRILEAMEYTGLVEVEWKRDSTTDELKFLEVNGRCWGWHSLGTKVVGRLGLMLHQYLHGAEVKRVKPEYGARWVKHVTDIPVVFDLWRRGDLSFGEYVRSLRGELVWCEWEPGDPCPFFFQFFLLPYLMKQRGY